MMALLEVSDLHAHYGAIEALKGVSLSVDAGEVITLVGSNGAGKSTTLRSISGLTPASAGRIIFAVEDITRIPARDVVMRGIALAPEGRHCFPRMTVRENLDLGAYRRRGPEIAKDLERIYELFPRLKERERQKAGTMSGGEQQMLAIGRALMAQPKLLMLDEPSLGIAPVLVQRIYETIREINHSGVAILLVEQNANYALDAARGGHVLETGRVVWPAIRQASATTPPSRKRIWGREGLRGAPRGRRGRNRWQSAVFAVHMADLGRRGVVDVGPQGLRRTGWLDAGPTAVGRGIADRLAVAWTPRLEVASRRWLPRRRRPL